MTAIEISRALKELPELPSLKSILLAVSKAVQVPGYKLVERGNEGLRPDARKVYSYIALMLGYTTKDTGCLINRDHSSVVQYRKIIYDRLQIKDQQTIEIIIKTLKNL